MDIYNTLPAPERHPDIPATAHWLAGEGAGSWYELSFNGTHYTMRRFAPNGKLECEGDFNFLQGERHIHFDIQQPFHFTYTSHCKRITLAQNNHTFIMWNLAHKR